MHVEILLQDFLDTIVLTEFKVIKVFWGWEGEKEGEEGGSGQEGEREEIEIFLPCSWLEGDKCTSSLGLDTFF